VRKVATGASVTFFPAVKEKSDFFTTTSTGGTQMVSDGAGTLVVVSTSGFPTSGRITVKTNSGWLSALYSGITATTFTNINWDVNTAGNYTVLDNAPVTLNLSPLAIFDGCDNSLGCEFWVSQLSPYNTTTVRLIIDQNCSTVSSSVVLDDQLSDFTCNKGNSYAITRAGSLYVNPHIGTPAPVAGISVGAGQDHYLLVHNGIAYIGQNISSGMVNILAYNLTTGTVVGSSVTRFLSDWKVVGGYLVTVGAANSATTTVQDIVTYPINANGSLGTASTP